MESAQEIDALWMEMELLAVEVKAHGLIVGGLSYVDLKKLRAYADELISSANVPRQVSLAGGEG